MFTELMPLLKLRALTITVAVLENEQIRVNVVPHSRPEDGKANDSIKYNHRNEVAAIPEASMKALTTPLSITGRAEEIDERFVSVLSRYAESHTALQESFDRASAEISDAVKAIDERNKSKAKEKASVNGKKEEKTSKAESGSKPDQSLPLWWTDPSAVAPGAAKPAETNKDIAALEQSIPQPQNTDVS